MQVPNQTLKNDCPSFGVTCYILKLHNLLILNNKLTAILNNKATY